MDERTCTTAFSPTFSYPDCPPWTRLPPISLTMRTSPFHLFHLRLANLTNSSDDFPDEVKGRRLSMEPTPDVHERPSKRLRLNNRAPSPSSPSAAHAQPPPLDDLGDISEDTDGSVPASPHHHPGMSQDDDFGQDQVTVCKWEGCEAGDLENMDNLVEHLHDDHIGTRQKKYSCEWSDCTRKGIPHASGYALRAHMRSHTREKPFYCTLPGMLALQHPGAETY